MAGDGWKDERGEQKKGEGVGVYGHEGRKVVDGDAV